MSHTQQRLLSQGLNSLFRSLHSPYYIWGFNYRETSSGIRVLHYLCHALNELGFEAYIHAGAVNPNLRTPVLTDEVIATHFKQGRKPIVVYPEVVDGQPLGVGVAVRYLLAKAGFVDGPKRFRDDEIYFAYMQEYVSELPVSGLLSIPASDTGYFHPGDDKATPRTGRYLFLNRYLERGGELTPETAGCIEISQRTPRTLEELGVLFRSAEVLFCYEASSIATEARLCGCPVVYLPNAVMMPEFPDNPLGRDGTAWGYSEEALSQAKATVSRVQVTYGEMCARYAEQLDHFIEVTQRAARDRQFAEVFPFDSVVNRGLDPLLHPAQYAVERAPDQLVSPVEAAAQPVGDAVTRAQRSTGWFRAATNLARNRVRRHWLGRWVWPDRWKSDVAPVTFVCATRLGERDFWRKSALGRSVGLWKKDARVSVRVAFENQAGLPEVYNKVLADDAVQGVVVFLHDDVWLSDHLLLDKLRVALKRFDVVGIAGNTRRVANQPAWLYSHKDPAKGFVWDSAFLSGEIEHGRPGKSGRSVFGPTPRACELLDGVFIAVRKDMVERSAVRFDEQFRFHFYDLDFCRSARQAGLSLGTWPIDIIHESAGSFGSESWSQGLAQYFGKWKK